MNEWKKWLFVLAGLVVTLELTTLAGGLVLRSKGVFYRPQPLDGYESYVEERDPLLGWPSPSHIGIREYDMTGSRIVPAFPVAEDGGSCAAVFGDSFTWGVGVKPEETYANVLSQLLGCRVANYGVSGYGSDQAYLRFKRRIRDDAGVVLLGHFTDDVLRNVNQYRGFLGGHRFGLKPRFVMSADGELQLVPLPELSADQLRQAQRGRAGYLEQDYFRPGRGAGITLLRFPWTLSLLRALHSYRIRAQLRAEPAHTPFYRADHGSGALPLTVAILEAFHRDARERGQQPVIFILPMPRDLSFFRRTGEMPYAALEEALLAAGIESPDVARRLDEQLGDRDPAELIVDAEPHYNREAHSMLARILFDWMQERGIDPGASL